MCFVEALACRINKCVESSLIFFGTAKQDCAIKTREIFSFLPLINNSPTIVLSLLLSMSACQQSYHQKRLTFCVSLDCILQYFD